MSRTQSMWISMCTHLTLHSMCTQPTHCTARHAPVLHTTSIIYFFKKPPLLHVLFQKKNKSKHFWLLLWWLLLLYCFAGSLQNEHCLIVFQSKEMALPWQLLTGNCVNRGEREYIAAESIYYCCAGVPFLIYLAYLALTTRWYLS